MASRAVARVIVTVKAVRILRVGFFGCQLREKQRDRRARGICIHFSHQGFIGGCIASVRQAQPRDIPAQRRLYSQLPLRIRQILHGIGRRKILRCLPLIAVIDQRDFADEGRLLGSWACFSRGLLFRSFIAAFCRGSFDAFTALNGSSFTALNGSSFAALNGSSFAALNGSSFGTLNGSSFGTLDREGAFGTFRSGLESVPFGAASFKNRFCDRQRGSLSDREKNILPLCCCARRHQREKKYQAEQHAQNSVCLFHKYHLGAH